jgi:two-component system sensor histidine kinase AlgZ
MARADSTRVRVLRTLAWVAVMGLTVGAALSAHRGVTVEEFAITVGISMLYGTSIGVPAMLVFRWLRPRLVGSGLRQWLICAGVLLVITLVAGFVVGLVLAAIGLTSLDDLWTNYLHGLQISLAIAIPIAVGATSFSRLNARLAAAELERQRAVALAAEARLASLESRIRPHFLFNALNSALALIPEEPASAEKVLERLCVLLRFSLDAQPNRLIPLGEALQIVTDYLEIERVRFGARLAFELDVPDELRAIAIPAFAVQTLVENSVKYAVSPRKQGARIVICARRSGDRLILEITDDGPGFQGPVWIAGHGLDGLRARLDALYGPAATLVAPALSMTGTTGAAVTIELPT